MRFEGNSIKEIIYIFFFLGLLAWTDIRFGAGVLSGTGVSLSVLLLSSGGCRAIYHNIVIHILIYIFPLVFPKIINFM